MTTIFMKVRLRGMNRRAATIATTATLTLLAAGCGSGSSGDGATSAGTTAAGGQKIDVVASFYPLEYLTSRVGGDHVSVTNLTKPGVEPHDLELTPQDVAKIGSAKLAVYEKGMQPAVDKAVAEQSPKGAYDVSGDADLTLAAPADADEEHKDGATGASSAAPSSTGNATDAKDPHFWLDPVRYGKVAKSIAAKLGEADPANKADYDKNADAVAKDLDALDKDFAAGLKTCANKDLVTSHAAFGYLAQRYQLTQEPIAGISPDAEPEPAKLAEITNFVKAHKVTTIYTETLVSPAIAQTIASSTGATTAVLDPIEGINDKSAGKNYLEVMRANLQTLKKGQSCS